MSLRNRFLYYAKVLEINKTGATQCRRFSTTNKNNNKSNYGIFLEKMEKKVICTTSFLYQSMPFLIFWSGSFAVQYGNNLLCEIICSPGIICEPAYWPVRKGKSINSDFSFPGISLSEEWKMPESFEDSHLFDHIKVKCFETMNNRCVWIVVVSQWWWITRRFRLPRSPFGSW